MFLSRAVVAGGARGWWCLAARGGWWWWWQVVVLGEMVMTCRLLIYASLAWQNRRRASALVTSVCSHGGFDLLLEPRFFLQIGF
ncbi:hypothetical protein HanRHA438_Chr01g0006711 [Helianthus annuus]|nr:hypothetical protein HanRHA438_Chr01g0006711 [Helianthus annuus]